MAIRSRWIRASILLSILSLLLLVEFRAQPAWAASQPMAALQADTCFVSVNDGGTTDYASADATALQTAVNNASPGDTLKIAGLCPGVQVTSGMTQTVYISKTLTLRGGYTTTNWTVSDPDTYPSTLSANDLGRVILITDTAKATIENLIVMSGTANAGGGLYVDTSAGLSLLNSQVMSNTATGSGLAEGGGGLGNLGQTVISGTTLSDNHANSGSGGGAGNGANGKLTIENSTFSYNSAATAGALGNSGHVTVTASSFISNTAGGAGAIGNLRYNALDAPGWMRIENSTFLTNTALDKGGAIDNDGGEMHIAGATFSANTADSGGAIYNNDGASDVVPALYITNTTFISNTAGANGGGAIRHRAGTVSIDSSAFTGNSTTQHGGAIRVRSSADSITISNSTLDNNKAVGNGGGILNNAAMTLSNVEIVSNTAQTLTNGDGGGLYNESKGIVTITQSTFAYNHARYGGGLENLGQLSLSESSVLSNTASSDGAGIQNWDSLTATGTTIAHNIADDDVGGLLNLGQATLTNSTVSHNQGLGKNHNVGGGGLYQIDDGTPPQLHLIHTTIVSNTSNNGGDGLYLIHGQATFTNTIIAYNGTENCALEGTSSFVSGGYNLEDSNTCTLTAGSDITNTNPLLAPLADNGGDTQTHALKAGSPAIDQIPVVDCVLADDQRGIARPQGSGCDMGAFEYVPYAPSAEADFYTATEDETLTVSAVDGVLANDSDANGEPLTATLLTGPTVGTLLLAADGSFVYTPPANYFGNVPFTYSASDGDLTDTAEVTISVAPVNDPPVAEDDAYTTDEDVPLIVPAPGVLGNDTDVENPPYASLESGPSHGTLTLNLDGSFIYTPTLNYYGSDSFSYAANDYNSEKDIATVDITVTPVNDSPTTENDVYTTDEDTPLIVPAPGLLGNDTDIDSVLTASRQSGPSNGALTLNTDGSFTYTPSPNFYGSDGFSYIASDGQYEEAATVDITVTPVFDPSEFTLTVNKVLVPATDDGLFVMDADGTIGAEAGDGATASATVTAGQVATFAESAGAGAALANYATEYSCDDPSNTSGSAISGSLSMPSADVTCTFTNTRQVGTVESATGLGPVTYAVDNCVIDTFEAVDESSLPSVGKPSVDFAYGFFGLKLVSCPVGGTANVTIDLPNPLPVGSELWKYQGNWFQYPFGSDDGDNVITLALTDGAVGDADGVANGEIVDPAGPGMLSAGDNRIFLPIVTK